MLSMLQKGVKLEHIFEDVRIIKQKRRKTAHEIRLVVKERMGGR